jgi:hypothetical protein
VSNIFKYFQTLCQIFPFLVPLKLGARQFLFQVNYDDGKENIFQIFVTITMRIRLLIEKREYLFLESTGV